MVDPISDEERDAFTRWVKLVFVLLVAVSAALITVQSGAGLVGVLTAGGAGAAVGLLLLWLAFP